MGVRKIGGMRRAVSGATLALWLLGQAGAVLAETPLEIEPTPETLPDLAPGSVQVTDPAAIKAALDDLTILEHKNNVSANNCTQTMRNYDRRAVRANLVERGLDVPLSLCIERRCCLIQKNNLG